MQVLFINKASYIFYKIALLVLMILPPCIKSIFTSHLCIYKRALPTVSRNKMPVIKCLIINRLGGNTRLMVFGNDILLFGNDTAQKG